MSTHTRPVALPSEPSEQNASDILNPPQVSRIAGSSPGSTPDDSAGTGRKAETPSEVQPSWPLYESADDLNEQMILRRDIRVRLRVNRPLPPLTRVIAASRPLRPLHCRPNPTGSISFRASEAGENRTNEKKQQVFATLFGCCLCQIAPAAQNAKSSVVWVEK